MRFSRRAKRRIVLLAVVGVALSAGVVVFRVVHNAQQTRLRSDARTKGLAAYEKGDFDGALQDLAYVIQQEKDDPVVLLAFADARARTPMAGAKHMLEALGYYKAGVDLLRDPTVELPENFNREARMQSSWSRMLDMYATLGMKFEVRQTAEKVLAHNPNDVDALMSMAQVLYADRAFADALRITARLVELQPQELRWRELHLGIMLQANRPYDELLNQCETWAKASTSDGRYHVLKSAVLAEAGRFERAREEIRAAATLGSDTLDVLNKMVSMLDALGLHDLAGKVIQTAGERYPDAQWVQLAIVRRLWQSNQTDAALAKITEVESRYKQLEPELTKLKAVCLMATGNTPQAIATLEPMAHTEGTFDRDAEDNRSWARAVMARINANEDDFEGMISEAEHALVLQPRDPVLHSILGQTYAQMGEDALSAQHFERAYRLDPSWLAAGVTYIESLLRIGRVGEAYQVSVQMLHRQPTNIIAPYVLCAQAYIELMRTGQFEQIASTTGATPDLVAILEGIHEQSPADPTVAALLAESYVITGRIDLAKRFIEATLTAQKPAPLTLLALSEVSSRYDLGSTEALIARAATIDNSSLSVVLAQADMLASAGKPIDGLAAVDRFIASMPEDQKTSVETQRGRIGYMLRTQHPSAMQSLREFVAQHKESAGALTFALAQSEAWKDRELIRSSIDQLSKEVGRQSQQVRLAEANYLLRYKSDAEADLARAMMLIKGVLEETPDSLAALTLLANASMLGERPSLETAISHLQRAVERYPGATSLYPVFISLLQRQGDFAKAERYLDRFARLTAQQPRWRQEEVRLLQAQGKFELALVKATSLINDQSGEADRLALANMYQRSGRTDAAKEVFENLLAEPNPSSVTIEQAAQFYAITGQFERAQKLLENYQAPKGVPWRRELLLGQFLTQYGDPAAAESHLAAAAQAAPDNADVQYEYARYCLSMEKFQTSHATAMRGLRIDANHQGLRIILALAAVHLDTAARDQTLAFWTEIGGGGDALNDLLVLLQKIRYREGHLEPTARDLDEARALVAKHGVFLPAWTFCISLLADAGMHNDAIDMARRAVGRFPSDAQTARWASNMLMAAGRWEEAVPEVQEWRRRTLDDPIDADVAMTVIMLEMSRAQDAMRQLQPHAQRIIDQRDRRPQRVGPWLRALIANDQFSQAFEIAKSITKESPRWRNLWTNLTREMKVKQAYEALAWVEPIVQLPSEYLDLATAWNDLAQRSGELSYFARADAMAVRAAELDSSLTTEVLLARGMVAQGQGDAVVAERYYRQVIERDPGHVTTLNNLAYLLVSNGHRYDQALPYIEHAVQLAPRHPDLLDTLGQVLAGLGKLKPAQDAFTSARALRPYDTHIGLNLAEVLLRLGQSRDASLVLQDVQEELELSWPRDEKATKRLEDLRTRLKDMNNAQAGSLDQSSSAAGINQVSLESP